MKMKLIQKINFIYKKKNKFILINYKLYNKIINKNNQIKNFNNKLFRRKVAKKRENNRNFKKSKIF